LNAALNYININGRFQQRNPENIFIPFEDSKSLRSFGDEMYIN
jgi:hypothetical protein